MIWNTLFSLFKSWWLWTDPLCHFFCRVYCLCIHRLFPENISFLLNGILTSPLCNALLKDVANVLPSITLVFQIWRKAMVASGDIIIRIILADAFGLLALLVLKTQPTNYTFQTLRRHTQRSRHQSSYSQYMIVAWDTFVTCETCCSTLFWHPVLVRVLFWRHYGTMEFFNSSWMAQLHDEYEIHLFLGFIFFHFPK